ncbi:hypothetical protein A3C28_05390 [Candidatus Roizmanbacteria bacterium RIFCSPHIGHO2_02_FULL_39_9]|uniref:Glycosyltransferase n=2 Tax=Candidatus Roizmaniibacteriota TaxID=1752723 RepID=A0A1F7I3L8_9BACT|nr:MAG: hypothetical protein A3C28_05390 [Candidatus Roizmanbacteria bacterium RIFCSPHIGHO2_02_FULL_39_9]OGK37984.1 MAG: hypothetical protein A3F60_04310 [Candidatus Roizmanbacteria bacterium RIFCSPHIGHO2_12_FULL_39_8]
MRQTKLLEIGIPVESKKIVLEKIKKYIESPGGWMHIVSINTENIVIAQENKKFHKVLQDGPIKILDGAGIVLSARILGIEAGERVTGVDLMEEVVRIASLLRLRVLLIGGGPNLALRLAQCYSRAYPEAKFKGIEGIQNIKKPLIQEESDIFSIVTDYKPHIIFVAFGSPDQELWLDRHSSKFDGIVCMGVGGAFDYISGEIPRAPAFLRKMGLEWFFRLLLQPWRWRRQLRLLKFIQLIVQQKFSSLFASP